jgi:signal transduction histidine kinase/ligand-binding sensor domain-containing protein
MRDATGFEYLRRFLCLAIIALAPLTLRAQEARFRIERIATRDGLLQSSVYSIMQDHYGFIWFGTVRGLERYDGYRFHSYLHDPFNVAGLSDYRVNSIAEDSAGYIWAGTESGGLNRLDRRTGRFTRFLHDARDIHTLSSDQITSLVADRNGGMWIGTRGGLDHFDARTGRIVRYDTSRSGGFTRESASSLYSDRRGSIWVCTRSLDPTNTVIHRLSISLYNAATDRFTIWFVTASSGELRFLDEQSDGMLDIGLLNNVSADTPLLYRFDPVTGTSKSMDVSHRPDKPSAGFGRFALMVDETGECWYAAPVGAVSIRGPQQFYSILCEPAVTTYSEEQATRSLANRTVVSGLPHVIFRDRSGTVWIGMEDGIVRISRVGSGFTTWRHDPNDSMSLSVRRIRSVQVDWDDALWVGTDFGLNRYDPASDEWHRYFSDPSQPGTLPNSTINVIYQDRNGTLLFGTNGGLAAYDEQHNRFSDPLPTFRPGPRSQWPALVWSILRDRQGSLWVGTASFGLIRFDSSGRLLQWFHHDPAREGSILDGGIWCLLEDHNGTIWAGTNEGLCRWMPQKGTFRCYAHHNDNSRSLGGKRIWALYEDRGGDIWASSFGGGISHYNAVSDDFTTITTHDGLADNCVFGLLEDDAGIFWISTTRGLVRWDRRGNTFRLYDADDGLQANEFAFKAFFKNPDGTLYFGGVNGLSGFKPSSLHDNPFVPPIAITGFHLFDSLVASELFDGDTVRLDHTQNFFSFEFAALDYINPGKNRYAYMLEGIDPAWFHIESDHRVAGYTDLEPGTYTFRVLGSNNDAVWNQHGIAVTVIIAPPWWGTWWFRTTASIIALALVITALRIRINGIRRHEREKRESAVQGALEMQETERQRIARDLHDGVGQMLAAAGINLARLGEMIDRHSASGNGEVKMRGPLDRAMGIIGRAGDDVRAVSHALGTSTVRELGLAAALGELLVNIEAQEKTAFEFVTVGMDERLPEAVEIGLFRVAQELIANVLRHSGATEAGVQIIRDQQEIRLTVEDNGRGFDITDTNGGGIGLHNIAARVTVMGGRLHYDSTPGHGTTVTVVVGEER